MRIFWAGCQGIVLFLLAGCGYQLSPPVSLQTVEVSVSEGIDSAVRRLLEQAPGGAGGVTDAAPLSLILHEEIYLKYPIAAAAFDEATEFDVTLQWVFSLKNNQEERLVDAERVTANAQLTRHNQRLVAASETERARLAQLRAELASQLRDRIQPWLDADGSK
ncbi:MAG: hypothetical protein HN530_05080 [Gammaproteobacteria bacterium]|jgi:outer membrane lipopolysaccharide assembly protein LptE/RlpB|nr:hypothetical protein [Gammaproteobacteria bacterium]